MHKCDYANLIGQKPEWVEDEETGRLVCNFCHVEREVPKVAPKATTTTRKNV